MISIDSAPYRYAMLVRYIEQLRKFFTIQPPIDTEALEVLNGAGEHTQMIRWIVRCLKLDMQLTVGYVNNGGPANAPAWIESPDPFPPFGTRNFRSLRLTMYVRKSFLDNAPFEAKVLVFAHELTHVVLNATGNPLRQEEPAVDLTAMMLGFRECYVVGTRYAVVPPKVPLWHNPTHYLRRQLIQMGWKRPDTVQNLGYLSLREVVAANRLIAERTSPV